MNLRLLRPRSVKNIVVYDTTVSYTPCFFPCRTRFISHCERSRSKHSALRVKRLLLERKYHNFKSITLRKNQRGANAPPLIFGRGDKIRTCDFYVPNVALYQAEPHLVIELFLAPRALPVVTKPLSSLLCNLPIGKSLPLLFVRFFRH